MFLGDVLTTDVEITARRNRSAPTSCSGAFPEDREARERDDHRGRRRRAATSTAASRRARRSQAVARGRRDRRRHFGRRRALVSRDGDARALLVGLGFDGEDDVDDVYDVVRRLDDEPGYEAAITGELTSDADQGELSADDLRTGELFFGLPVALVILLLVFGAVVAGLVPLILAIVSIVVALAARSAAWPGLRAVAVHGEHAHRDGPGARDRLLAVRPLALPRGALARPRPARRDRRRRRDGEPRRPFQRHDVRARDVRAGARAEHDLPQPRRRGDPRRHRLGARRATLLPALLGLLGDRVDALRIPFFGRGASAGGGTLLGRVVRASCGGRWSASCSRGALLRSRRPCSGSTRARRARAAARPLRVQTGLRPAQPGVPRPDDRSCRDRGRRRRRAARHPPPRAELRGARSSATRVEPSDADDRVAHSPDRRRPDRRAGDQRGPRTARRRSRARSPGRRRDARAGDTAEELDSTTRSTPGSCACSPSCWG